MSEKRLEEPPGEHEKYRALYTLGSTLTFNTLIEAERLANLALSMLVEFTGAGCGHLLLLDEEGAPRHRFGMEQGESPTPSPLDPGEREGLQKLAIHGASRLHPGGRVLDVALRADETAVGAIRLERREPAGPFSAGDRALVEACATHLAQSLRSRQLYEAHLAQKRRADLVERVTRAVHGTGDLEEILGVVIRSATEALGAGAGAIILGDGAGRLGVAASHGRLDVEDDSSLRTEEERLVGWVFAEGTPTSDGQRLLTPMTQVLRGHRMLGERRRSPHATPFTRTLGVLLVEKPPEGAPFPETGLAALQVFADHASAAVINNALVRQASLDPLTGLDSRLQLEPRLEEELAFARRHDLPVSVIMADVDHFKRTNDLHGHQAGDEVLCQIARILKDAVRRDDICARYGGEEFLVVLPETNLSGGQVVAENIRQRVAAALFTRERIPVTVSLGVAQFPLHSNTAAGLMRCADRALYEAKQAGRNCTRTAHTP